MPSDTETDALDPFAGSLSHSEPLVLLWQPLPTLDGVDIADGNRRAAALLTLLGNLDEPVQPPEDEPHFTAQLQRLDQKIDLLLNLVGQWLTRELALPAPQPARLGVRGVLWQADLPPGAGRVDIYLRAGLPVALSLPATLQHASAGQVLAEFQGLDAAVTEGLERYIFRCHRRAVAQARRPG
jgi:hypothetical protein